MNPNFTFNESAMQNEITNVMDYLFLPKHYMVQMVIFFVAGYLLSNVDVKYAVALAAAVELYAYNMYADGKHDLKIRAVVLAAGVAGYYVGKNKMAKRFLAPL